MNKHFKLWITCIILLSHPLSAQFNDEQSFDREEDAEEQIIDIQYSQIIEVIDIEDEWDPAELLILENGLKLECSWYSGSFYEGQPVKLEFYDNKLKLVMITSSNERITFFNFCNQSNYYIAL